ncbi:MAG TPA: hypothetical protein PL048_19990, partial [Leptospiraceae bacterium]|nr:hypothetical protein [Leptospiraceae bacterium]
EYWSAKNLETMNTVWNHTKEGRQYWVRLKRDSMNLEFISDPVSELAGGGYSFDLPEDLSADTEELKELGKVFTKQDLQEMQAFSRALKKLKRSDIKNRTERFYQIYYEELENL